MTARATLAIAAVVALVPVGAVAAELRLYNWADYTSPEVIARFEAATGHTVVIETFDSNEEMLERLKTGASGFDLAFPSEYSVRQLIDAGQLERVMPHRLPGFENIGETWRGQSYDPGNDYALPWHWGTTSFVVDTDAYRGDIDTLKLIYDPPPGITRVGVLDDGDDMVTNTLRYLGLPRCSKRKQDLEQVEKLLVARAKDMEIFDAREPVEWLVNSRAPVAMAWNGDAMRARQRRPALRYAYPREGVTVWTDTMVVPKGAGNREGALAFMAFMLKPENAALQSNYTGYANAILGSEALLSPDLQKAPEVILPAAVKLEFLQACDAAVYDAYQKLWSRVKATRKLKKK